MELAADDPAETLPATGGASDCRLRVAARMMDGRAAARLIAVWAGEKWLTAAGRTMAFAEWVSTGIVSAIAAALVTRFRYMGRSCEMIGFAFHSGRRSASHTPGPTGALTDFSPPQRFPGRRDRDARRQHIDIFYVSGVPRQSAKRRRARAEGRGPNPAVVGDHKGLVNESLLRICRDPGWGE
jgi:hypothetical protein